MTNQIENENKDGFDEQILIGQVDIPNKRIHIFRSMQAMTDFVNTFKISSGQLRTGHTVIGERVVELVYDVRDEDKFRKILIERDFSFQIKPRNSWYDNESVDLYACPECGTVKMVPQYD